MPKARSSDRSLASPYAPDLLYPPPRGCRLHSGLETSASPPREEHTSHREKYEQPRARAGERGRLEVRGGRRGRGQGCGTPKGVRPSGVDTLLGISTYDCPGGVHRSAKQSSPGLDPSRALRALFSAPPPPLSPSPGKGLRIEIHARAPRAWISLSGPLPLLLPGFELDLQHGNARLTEFPKKSRWLSLLFLCFSFSLVRSSHCIYVYSVYPIDPQQSSPFTGEADQPASRIYGVRNSDDARSSSHVTSGNSVNFLFLCGASGILIFFLE